MLTIYTERIPSRFAGCTVGCVVLIRPAYRDDAGLHAHEACHVRQWWSGVLIGALAALIILLTSTKWSIWWPLALFAGAWLHALAYLVPRYRLWAEMRAYRVQLRYYPDDRTRLFAGFIAERYGLRVSEDEAEDMLKG